MLPHEWPRQKPNEELILFDAAKLNEIYAFLEAIANATLQVWPAGAGTGQVIAAPGNLKILLNLTGLADPDHPFRVNGAPDGAGNILATVTPGYLAGNAPTIGGTPITDDPAPALTISATGTQIVYLKLKATLSIANDYVYGAVLDTLEIDVAGTLPTDDLSTGEYYLRLATFNDGVKVSPQPILVNLNWYVNDSGIGNSEAGCVFIGA